MMRAVDLFAGSGGFSQGAKLAGVNVVWAGNHWPEAVKYHSLNHPGADHVCQDLQQADWALVPEHDLMLASPSCTGFTRARGKDKPGHDAARATAWAVVSCAEYHRPQFVLVENVAEFQQWVLYPAWELALQSLGYTMTAYVVDAADHGVPQNRKRLFIVCARSKAPLFLSLPKRQHQPAPIDWSAGKWAQIDRAGRSPATLARIANGRQHHGERFLLSYYGSTSGGRSLSRPVGTITTRDRWAVVDGDRMRMLTADECRAAMGFPADYHLPENHKLAVHMLGNAVCPPVARDLINGLRAA